MTSSTKTRSVGVAVVTILFIVAIWHSREKFPEHALHYIKSPFRKPRPSWHELALKHGTDKVKLKNGSGGHTYQHMYEQRLHPLRDRPIKMLEIGLGCDMAYGPGASYKLWLEYFAHVDLYFIEYDAACATKWANSTAGATIFTGDQADVASLEEFIVETDADAHQFDLVIDDGGHTMNQQRVSLDVLFDYVAPGGLYCVEDLGTSYVAQYGGGSAVGKDGSFMDDLKDMLDDMNRVPGVPDKSRISKDVVKLDFVQEVVCLQKRRDEDG